MNDDEAMALLRALSKQKGALRIITAARSEVDEADAEPRFAGNPMADPRMWVCHDVVRIEGPDARGRVRAHSREGDICLGYPRAVLRRLTEAALG